jgi:hypothetical protein
VLRRRPLAKSFLNALAVPFVECPSADHIKTYMDTILLLTTLMLGFGVNFFSAFMTEDLDAADLRWYGWCRNETLRALPRIDSWCEGVVIANASLSATTEAEDTGLPELGGLGAWRDRPSFLLGQRSVWAYATLAASLALALAQYMIMLAFRIDEAPDTVRARWWRFFQWPCHLAFGLFFVGTFFFVWSNAVGVRLVFTADMDRLVAGAEGGGVWDSVQTSLWTVFGLFVGVLVLDAGLWLRWFALDHEKDADEVVPKKVDAISQQVELREM